MKYHVALKRVVVALLVAVLWISAASGQVSTVTDECIACHASVTPGLVDNWRKSRHANVTPAEALKKTELQRRLSADSIPEKLAGVVVGCAECHTLNAASHKDTFVHHDQQIHLTVTPKDCAVCHLVEARQYEKNLMSHARKNLVGNPAYQALIEATNAPHVFDGAQISLGPVDTKTNEESCFHCHGTAVEVTGKEIRGTDFGDMEFPKLSGWPNQGVGRFNPDGSQGSCSSCHPRHQFSIKGARKPHTCSQCHKGPDVPAYKIYSVSKHGNLAASLGGESKYEEVPWVVGKDFSAPTCAACHVSLVVTSEGDVISKRTHQMNDRLPWRLFGLPYAHPHPASPDTTIIRNKEGISLPTSFDGTPASGKFLIGKDEQNKRREAMQRLCLACHTRDWVNGHWERLENTIASTNLMTLTATQIMQQAWTLGLADPHRSMFDEAVEKLWTEQWLFFANSVRLASAMMGADYGVFADGRWQMAKRIQELNDYVTFLRVTKQSKP